MNSSKIRDFLNRMATYTYLLPAICVVCCATALAQTSGITEPSIRTETSSGLTPSQTDAVEPDSIKQRLGEVASSFTKNDAFMGAVLVAKGPDIVGQDRIWRGTSLGEAHLYAVISKNERRALTCISPRRR